jgi:hypothetical protein
MKQLAQAVLHSGNNQLKKYSRHLPKAGIIAQAWNLASTISDTGIFAASVSVMSRAR